jgi:hypothetical protein
MNAVPPAPDRSWTDLPGRSIITVASWFEMPTDHADATTAVLWEAAFALRG